MGDVVSHPDHYCKGRKYEPKDVIYDWGLDFNLGSAVKYLSRAGRKAYNSKEQDLEKAIQYIQFELDEIDKKEKECMKKAEEPHWIERKYGDYTIYVCSKCYGAFIIRHYFCPHCKSKMKAWKE